MLICDTSGLVAYFDGSDAHHSAARQTVENDDGPFIVSPYVLAELDYLLASRRGTAAELAALNELTSDAWDLPHVDAGGVRRALELIGRYRDQNIGLADASLVVLADRYRTDRMLTLDRRHFSVLVTLGGRPFTLLPA